MIGRKKEICKLKELYNSSKAELVAVYGRRRVGKTFLVNECFKGAFTFRHAGLSPIEMEDMMGDSPRRKQLKHFYNSLILHGMKRSRCPDNWLDAFLMLEMFLESKDNGKRLLVFLDELPWMDTQKSGFVTAFEGFWNTWASFHDNVMVVVCGSATSWIMDKLINNHGGLYGRVTYEIKLSPFTLKECEAFFREKSIKLSPYDITQAYMISGGIPYYLGYYEKGFSLAQNVDRMFFEKKALLKNEYTRLFNSAFSNPEMIKTIVEILNTKNSGYTRAQLSEKSGFSTGGTLSDALQALVASDFVIQYSPFGRSKRDSYYKLVDPFCIFYLKFVHGQTGLDPSFWQKNVTSQQVTIWRGIAFENVCLHHIEQIKAALGISGVSTKQTLWTKRADDTAGTQIDLLIERNDHVVNMCEMKFYNKDFVVDKDYYRIITNRRGLLEEAVPKEVVVHSTLVTTYGLKYNEYSGIFDNVVCLEDLFQ